MPLPPLLWGRHPLWALGCFGKWGRECRTEALPRASADGWVRCGRRANKEWDDGLIVCNWDLIQFSRSHVDVHLEIAVLTIGLDPSRVGPKNTSCTTFLEHALFHPFVTVIFMVDLQDVAPFCLSKWDKNKTNRYAGVE